MKINTTLVKGEPQVKMNHLLHGTEGQQSIFGLFPSDWHKWVAVRLEDGNVKTGVDPISRGLSLQ